MQGASFEAVGYTAPRGGVPDSLKRSALHDCSAVAAFMKTVATFMNMRTPAGRAKTVRRKKTNCKPGRRSTHAGRMTMPSGMAPSCTSRHKAINSLRASATIIVLRIPGALPVRWKNH